MDEIRFGQRTIPDSIDDLARRHPDRVWARFPTDSNHVCEISFGCCARAVNTASWWLRNTIGDSSSFETIAYVGPNDIRYIILFCAASKCGYKILFTSPRNSHECHTRLMQTTSCKYILYDSTSTVKSLHGIPRMRYVPVPSLRCWLEDQIEHPFSSYPKKFDQVKDDPCVVLHTSGTTSPSKPIVLTHGQLAVFDAQWLIPPLKSCAQERRMCFLQAMSSCSPFLVALPFFHMAGFSMGVWLPLNPNMSVAFTNPSNPLSLLSIEQAIDSVRVCGAIIPPVILEEAAECPMALDKITRLKYIFYGGAPLSYRAGLAISSSSTHLCNQIGSTECVVYTTHLTDKADWEYFCFGSDWSGYVFRTTDATLGLFEMVVVQDERKRHFQAAFQGNENSLAEFRTGDLYSKHPSKPQHWKHEGRLDDLIILSNGEKINPIPNEALINSHTLLKASMYVGNRRPQPAIILELKYQRGLGTNVAQVIKAVWPLIKRANDCSPGHAQLQLSHVLIAEPSKPFLRTSKGTLRRRQTAQLYEIEINHLYLQTAKKPLRHVEKVDITHQEKLRNFVLRVFQEAAESSSLQVDDDVFLAGADSIKARTAVSKLKACVFSSALCIDTRWIEQKTVYAHPTARSMARFLENLGRPQDSLAHTLLDGQRTDLHGVYERYRQKLPFQNVTKTRADRKIPITVLLTGSTGNLGSYLLEVLLGRKDVDQVICLNRRPDAAELQRRGNLERGLCTSWATTRVKFFHADLSKPRLGLDTDTYGYVASKTTAILHNQWPVDFNLSLSSFEPQIQGTVNLISLAVQATYGPRFFFVSSISAINNWRRQIGLGSIVKPTSTSTPGGLPICQVPERFLTDLSLSSSGYGASKAIASDLLHYASARCGLRSTTVRLGQVAGPLGYDGKGAWSTKEWLPRLVASSLVLGALPLTIPLLNEIDWVPVDLTAQIIVELMLGMDSSPLITRATATAEKEEEELNTAEERPSREQALFNVANPRTVVWETLIPAVQRYAGGRLRIVSYGEWLALLEKAAVSSDNQPGDSLLARVPALKLLDFFQQLEEGRKKGAQQTTLRTDITRQSSKCLAELGPIKEYMMEKWLEQWSF
ncbi:acetyl-CoA synthetase-like protein [Apiospora arundinis]|uniref:Acetyl-CoA synthetase-like protein n=1 Tax=Apiospora arundinis TaxID=335852 RepID=A0ABR2HQR7_9PEZI